jgi:hypothetical protein
MIDLVLLWHVFFRPSAKIECGQSIFNMLQNLQKAIKIEYYTGKYFYKQSSLTKIYSRLKLYFLY